MKIEKLYETAKDTAERLSEISPKDRIYEGEGWIPTTLTLKPEEKFQKLDKKIIKDIKLIQKVKDEQDLNNDKVQNIINVKENKLKGNAKLVEAVLDVRALFGLTADKFSNLWGQKNTKKE